MDWNQDPYLQRLEEKLDRVLERLDLIEEKIGQPRKFHTIQEVAEILGVKERTVSLLSQGVIIQITRR